MKHQLPWEILMQIQPFSWIYFVITVGVEELSKFTVSHCTDQQKEGEQQMSTTVMLIPGTGVQR